MIQGFLPFKLAASRCNKEYPPIGRFIDFVVAFIVILQTGVMPTRGLPHSGRRIFVTAENVSRARIAFWPTAALWTCSTDEPCQSHRCYTRPLYSISIFQ
jgi:hypothetical protein